MKTYLSSESAGGDAAIEDVGKRVWFITGGAGGLGRALLDAVLEGGERAVATYRVTDSLADLEALYPMSLVAVRADVTSLDDIGAAVNAGISAFGRLDVIVNNAGLAVPGALEELDDDTLRGQFEVNFFGMVNVLRATLPHLREARTGQILQISSLAGQVGAAGMSAYTSSKHAVEGLSASLRAELAPFGIRVVIVEPGSHRTAFRRNWASRVRTTARIADYEELALNLSRTGKEDGGQTGDPARSARALLNVVDLADLPLRVVLGSDAFEGIKAARSQQIAELEAMKGISISVDYPLTAA